MQVPVGETTIIRAGNIKIVVRVTDDGNAVVHIEHDGKIEGKHIDTTYDGRGVATIQDVKTRHRLLFAPTDMIDRHFRHLSERDKYPM